MTRQALDLDAYLARIGYNGPVEPTLEVLRAIQFAHVQTIPFENIDVLLGRRIEIDLPSVVGKLVVSRRGGYCFEQNTLFREVLAAIGFRVTPLLARVRRNVPPEVRTPLTHMVLVVEIEGHRWLADVGFGSVGITAPISLETDESQGTPLEPHRLVPADGGIMHQAKLGEEWVDVYLFIPDQPPPIDFELGNWFSCTHPRALFTNNLVVTRVDGRVRHSIQNREFTTRSADGSAEKQTIESPAHLLELLDAKFGLRFPAGTRIDIPAVPWD